jgi:hypothetical protein
MLALIFGIGIYGISEKRKITAGKTASVKLKATLDAL